MLKLVACRSSLKNIWFPTAGLKNFSPIGNESIESVERPKLRVVERSPQYPPNLRPPKLQKKLNLMRGPELIHNTLLHNQFGIIATSGGRLRWGHFEMMRLTIGRKMDTNRMFAVWRVPAPWQPITKKGQGQRMGGGKGAIDHYVTPIKSGRIILELAGNCEYAEVKSFLKQVSDQLPFKASPVSQEIMKDMSIAKGQCEIENSNPYSFKYAVKNNLSGCHRWLSPKDHKWFGKFI